jgi:hypothetical protein
MPKKKKRQTHKNLPRPKAKVITARGTYTCAGCGRKITRGQKFSRKQAFSSKRYHIRCL